MPGGFNLQEFRTAVQLVESLYPLLNAVETLYGKLTDTCFAAGSEAYAAALLADQYAKLHHVATGALEDSLDDLGRRFRPQVQQDRAPGLWETSMPAMDCSILDMKRRMTDMDRSIPQMERRMSDMDRSMLEMDRGIFDMDWSIPNMERRTFNRDRSIPNKGRWIFGRDRSIPNKERWIFDIDRSILEIERWMSEMDCSISEIGRWTSEMDQSISEMECRMFETDQPMFEIGHRMSGIDRSVPDMDRSSARRKIRRGVTVGPACVELIRSAGLIAVHPEPPCDSESRANRKAPALTVFYPLA